MNEEKRPAVVVLTELAQVMRSEMVERDWFRIDGGFGIDVYADYRDAEFHLRALYRIIGANVAVTA